MNAKGSNNLKSQMKRLLSFLAVLLITIIVIISDDIPNPAYAYLDNRDRPDPIITPPPFEPPAGGFTWSVPRRYGFDSDDGDSMIDTHWIAAEMRYDPAYIYPDYWPMAFNGCQTSTDAESPTGTTNTYQWDINGQTLIGNTCMFTYQPGNFIGGVEMTGFPAQGTYTVSLTVTDPSGANLISVEQSVYIRDYFIVSVGDSYASGEGNPDIRQGIVNNYPFGYIATSDAVWQDKRCHRSAYSGPSQAAQDLEFADPKTSVTFISFACSGASINTWAYEAIGGFYPPLYDRNPDRLKLVGAGILDYYRGADVPSSIEYGNFANYIPPQIVQLQAALTPPSGEAARQFDALLLSAGGNDLNFGDIMAACWLEDDCWEQSMVYENPYSGPYHIPVLINRALGNLTTRYAELAGEISTLNPQPAEVYITQYPDQTRNDNGGYCTLMSDVWLGNTYKITPTEAQQLASSALAGLNQAIKTAAGDYSWQYVDGLATYEDPVTGAVTPGEFVSGPDGRGHGYCATDNWIRRAEESEIYQGPAYLRPATRGTMHPTERGHQVYAERILHYLIPNLDVVPNTDPPTFSSSFTSDGLTSSPGENSWFIGSYDSNNSYHPEVVLQVTATGSSPLTGASGRVNDTDSCSAEGVTCLMDVITATNEVQWDFAFSADGIYQMHFSVSDANDQVANFDTQIKVDLHPPIFTGQPWPFEVDEGGTLVLTATASDAANGMLAFIWDLDNDAIFETQDERPTFSAAELDGPTSPIVGVHVTDSAGWSATTTAAIDVLNAAPSAVINGAPAASVEGTQISLTSTVTDSGMDDTLTYAWEVKKDGVSFATGTDQGFSFTPDDNGSYVVSLSVADDDDGSVTSFQTIAVTNAAPDLSNVTVTPGTLNEGSSVTLTGNIAEAGSADTLALTIDWGDGSTAELIPLAAGSTSFSRTHTYSDDDPSLTPSDTYAIALSLADDDGATGTASTSAVVNNLAPTLSISAPAYGTLYALNTTVSLSALVSDASSDDTLTCSINWDNGAISSGTVSAGACSAERAYTTAGVYIIQMTAADDDSGSVTDSVMVVVYDASAGFVTGGGWFNSAAGAYKPDPSLSGQATFGFVSKYHKGANVPEGNTEFEFRAGGFEFASTSYEWLVVNQVGTNAQFKGTGLINGGLDPNGNAYKFMVYANDGASVGMNDSFRIRIWWEDSAGVEHDVYDNGVAQSLGGGNIVIHKDR